MTGSPANYDRVAPIYDLSKTLLFLGAIQHCQNHHLPLLKEAKRILLIGGGTGKIIKTLQAHCRFEALDYVDNSPNMIAYAERYIQSHHAHLVDKIKFHQEDIFNYSTATKYDAIVAPFVLDCFTDAQLDVLGEKLSGWMTSGGLLLFSDFHESESSGSSRLLSRMLTKSLYFMLNAICRLDVDALPNFERMFKKQHWLLVDEHTFFLRVLKSSAYKRV